MNAEEEKRVKVIYDKIVDLILDYNKEIKKKDNKIAKLQKDCQRLEVDLGARAED